MNLLIKVSLILAAIFTSTLLIIKFTGILTIEDIKVLFESIKSQPPYILGSIVVLLLFADLFIAVPTMTIIILSGYFLGFEQAILYVFLGLFSASLTGYILSWKYGMKFLNKLSKDEEQKEQMKTLFNQHGLLLLVLSRAVPMLAEISACLAGTCKMPFPKFILGWVLGSIPYLVIVSYAGSISDLNNPMPAIYTAIGITSILWLGWFFFMKFNRKKSISIKNKV